MKIKVPDNLRCQGLGNQTKQNVLFLIGFIRSAQTTERSFYFVLRDQEDQSGRDASFNHSSAYAEGNRVEHVRGAFTRSVVS